MNLIRPLVIVASLLLLGTGAALWWSQPAKVDMADYAPADALVYIEVNSITDIANAIQQTDTWKDIASSIGLSVKQPSHWSILAARSGLAPIQAVVSTRAQMALVVLGVNTAEKDDSLRIKPDVALIVETHTSKWRMKNAAVTNLKRLAEFAYGVAACTERTSQVDYVDCVEPHGSRKLIAAIDGSLVIIGNSDRAVQSCLEVRRGQRPSLHTDPELNRQRSTLRSGAALTFGYVSQANAAKLFSWGVPMLMGKTPGDQQLEQILANSAAKILRGISWTSTPSAGSIEDTYQISLEPEVIRQLDPVFEIGKGNQDYWKFIPDSFRSMTIYRSKDPQAAWFSLNSAVAMKLDAVTSIIFATLLKSGLSGYGIEDPKSIMSTLSPPLITLRPALGEGSLLLARVKDEEPLRQALANELVKSGRGEILNGIQSDPSNKKEFAAVFVDGFVVMGGTQNILVYLAQLRSNEIFSPDRLQTLELANHENTAAVITYTNERESLTTIISALSLFSGRTLSEIELTAIHSHLDKANFSSTESALTSTGIERRSRSAFGQFGSLLSIAQADSSNTSRP